MDNYTLIVTLFIVSCLVVFFTFHIANSVNEIDITREWRLSSVLISLSLLLFMTQGKASYFVSIILANYCVVVGFYLQAVTAVSFKTNKALSSRTNIPILTLIYLVPFLYFTYADFNTTARICVLSLIVTAIFGHAALKMRRYKRDNKATWRGNTLYYAFIVIALFNLFRFGITISEQNRISSILDSSALTTIHFLFYLLYHLVFLVGMFAAAIEKKNLHIKNETDKQRYLFEFLTDTAKHLQLKELYVAIESMLQKTIGVHSVAIYLVDETQRTHSLINGFNQTMLAIDKVKRFNWGEGVSGQVIETGSVVRIPADQHPITEIREEAIAKGISQLIGIPMQTTNGTIGAVTLIYTAESEPNQVLEQDFLIYLGEQVGLVLQNALLYQQLEELAHTDPLTGLLNRRKIREIFTHETNRIARQQGQLSIAILDIDHFKQVNDSFGHEAGDLLLTSLADHLRQNCREIDHISRWGGEEFVVIFTDAGLSAASLIAERLRSSFAEKSFSFLGNSGSSFSIGLAEYQPGASMEQIISSADKALYQAKRKGRNQVFTA